MAAQEHALNTRAFARLHLDLQMFVTALAFFLPNTWPAHLNVAAASQPKILLLHTVGWSQSGSAVLALTGVFDVVQDATSQDIRALFAQFGTIKPQNGAITVKHNGNNNSFAYVDFVDVASAQACVEAKDVQLYGTTVRVWLMIDTWLITTSPHAC